MFIMLFIEAAAVIWKNWPIDHDAGYQPYSVSVKKISFDTQTYMQTLSTADFILFCTWVSVNMPSFLSNAGVKSIFRNCKIQS